ncbi:MAG: S8 family serine peptidase [Bdellovibrionales bacterium]|nr:S8 family serine peptidase [Bdellovibrionales bacterium]
MPKLFTVLMATISFILMACGSNKGQVDQSSTPAKVVYTQAIDRSINLNPFQEQKVVFNIYSLANSDQNFNELNDSIRVESDFLASINNTVSDIIIPMGTDISILIDNPCVLEGSSKISALRLEVQDQLPLPIKKQIYNLQLKSDRHLSQLEEELEDDKCVIGVSESQTYHKQDFYMDDPRRSEQAYLDLIKAEESYALFDSLSLGNTEDVVVAVVDTGVDYNHEDLKNVMWSNADGKHGFDFVNNDDEPMDDNDHGSHVAGLIAADTNNGIGIAGTAGKNVKIMAVKVLSASGSGSDAANGVRYAVENGADIINMSLGSARENAQMAAALREAVAAGVTVVVAAGNDNKLITPTDFYSPAGYGKDIEGVITVGSVDALSGSKSSFSNYSTTYVEIGAPGSRQGTSGVLSTIPDNRYARFQGTSMASPVTAGAVALVVSSLKSNKISYDPALTESIIVEGADKRSELESRFVDGRRLNLLGTARVLEHVIINFDGGF